MNYREFKEKQQKEATEFTEDKLFFAFGTSKNEILCKLKKQGLNEDEIIGLGAGTYTTKTEYAPIMEFFDKQANELKEYTMNNLKEVLLHEFANYELEISMSYSYKSFLETEIGLTENEIKENETLIKEAIAEYQEDFYKHN